MGRDALGVGPVPGNHAEVAVLDARVEPHAVATTPELALERGHDRVALGVGRVAGREVHHRAVVADRDEIAAIRDLVGCELDAHRGRLDRRSARVELGRVEAQDRHVPDVTAGWEAVGDDRGATDLAACGERREVRHRRRAERGAPVEPGERLVGTAVGDEDEVLHPYAS